MHVWKQHFSYAMVQCTGLNIYNVATETQNGVYEAHDVQQLWLNKIQ